MKIHAAVVLVLCFNFTVGHNTVSDGDRGGLNEKRDAMVEFHNLLAKFASSLRNFEKKGQEVLSAATGKGNTSALGAEPSPAALEATIRRRSRKRHDRDVDDGGAAAHRSDDSSFKTEAYTTAGSDDLVQKRDDDSPRVFRIKILHHGHGDIARSSHSKMTPCPVAHLASVAVRRTTAITRGHKSTARVPSTQKIKKARATRAPTSKKTPSTSRSTSAPVKFCAQSDDAEVAQGNVEVQNSEHRHGESSGEDASEKAASQSRGDESASQLATQPPSEHDVHAYEPAADSERQTIAEVHGSIAAEDAQSATVKKTQATKGSVAKPNNLLPRGDHLRIHIIHKPSHPQADVNETFFANHSLVNRTGHDLLVVKTKDHFFVTNGSKAIKVREVDRGPASGEGLNYFEVRKNDNQEPYLGNQDYVEEFEKRVKQVNESLQRVRNYRQPSKAKRRIRRDNVRSMRSLRLAPPEEGDTTSRKGEIQRSRVVGAKSGNIRITINRRLDNDEGAQIASAGVVAPVRKTEPRADGAPLRHNIRVLGPHAEEVPLRNMAKRGANQSSSADGPSGEDVLEMLVNNSRGSSEPLLNLPGGVVAHVAYASASRPDVSKYEQLRFRALALTCVLTVVSVLTVAAVLTMLYFDLNDLFHFKRGFKYAALDLTESPYDDNGEGAAR